MVSFVGWYNGRKVIVKVSNEIEAKKKVSEFFQACSWYVTVQELKG